MLFKDKEKKANQNKVSLYSLEKNMYTCTCTYNTQTTKCMKYTCIENPVILTVNIDKEYLNLFPN